MANGDSFRWLVLTVSLMLWSGCSLQPLQQQFIGDLGRIEYRKAKSSNGVVVGVAHGIAAPAAVDYAIRLSAELDAGLAIAYGFASKRLPVTRPLVRGTAFERGAARTRRRSSVYPEFRAALSAAAGGPIKFYIGVRVAGAQSKVDRIELASSGFSFAQLRALKKSFLQHRERALAGSGVEKIDMAIDPLDPISWNVDGLKHHGVLISVERGLDMRLPVSLARGEAQQAYETILSQWMSEALAIVTESPAKLPRVEVAVLPYGKIELLPADGHKAGVVIGAPHGTFDSHTARVVRRICSQTGLAGVVATGFTPTESGDNLRINVNRPTERLVSSTEREIETSRAKITYEQFRKFVLTAAQEDLDLYIDIHQNGGPRIEVATVGLSQQEARAIKDAYLVLRDQALVERPEITAVDFAIEPLDAIEVGAWAAKFNGILAAAKKSLHFELPAYEVMASEREREFYTAVLSDLIIRVSSQVSARH